jgi:hypothetical protein
MSDVFARVGSFNYQGCQIVRADTLIMINSNDVVLDNVWVWHADHDDCGTNPEAGVYGKSDECHSTHGLVVNGHRATAYGMSVEHIVKGDNVLWNGEDGETYFYQCELPYHERGFKAHGYAVARSVKSHKAVGIGVYIIGADVQVKSGIVLPPSAEARHLYNVVIKGAAEQFQNIVCAYRDDIDSSGEACYGPESCKYGVCFRDSVPKAKLALKPKPTLAPQPATVPAFGPPPQSVVPWHQVPPPAQSTSVSPLHQPSSPAYGKEPSIATTAGIALVLLAVGVMSVTLVNEFCIIKTQDRTSLALNFSPANGISTAIPTLPMGDEEPAMEISELSRLNVQGARC